MDAKLHVPAMMRQSWTGHRGISRDICTEQISLYSTIFQAIWSNEATKALHKLQSSWLFSQTRQRIHLLLCLKMKGRQICGFWCFRVKERTWNTEGDVKKKHQHLIRILFVALLQLNCLLSGMIFIFTIFRSQNESSERKPKTLNYWILKCSSVPSFFF